ncbi:MAG: DNA mismatch repair protein MutL [Marinilabiliales bacterium]|nr:MAG: DNA mismatch repair protein MutL [Marinilabiliales bacterium]
MDNIIRILPDNVANQIAAGEVVQRPANVVKELVENAIDAGAQSITINIKDAGRTLIQIIDNGCGMTAPDARMAFERHATSKIQSADDLFSILTKGFRGEALASIAAIAHVELKTKRKEDELGTHIVIEGSKTEKSESCSCKDGSNFQVKNLFYNVPARRKFLKSNSTELRHIIDEFQRIALAHPDINFKLIHNDHEVFNLITSNYKQRIVNLLGKNREQNLISVSTDTSLVSLKGFVGKPELARKTTGEQFFFVNNRYMKHPYFYRAVLEAYDNLLPDQCYPSFFLYLTVDPTEIDINIHPTKTEIKFENEVAIWQIIRAAVKESLGKHNIVPSLDFEMQKGFEIPVLSKSTNIKNPEIKINPTYNPFEVEKQNRASASNWEKLYEGLENNHEDAKIPVQSSMTALNEDQHNTFLQYKGKYILTSVKSGLMVINQKRAHERVLFEKYLSQLTEKAATSQKSLYPTEIELSNSDLQILDELSEELKTIGFEITKFSKNSVNISSTPAEFKAENIEETICSFINQYKENSSEFRAKIQENLAGSLARAESVNYGKPLSQSEMRQLVDELFACSSPNYTFDGKTIISILQHNEIEMKFK